MKPNRNIFRDKPGYKLEPLAKNKYDYSYEFSFRKSPHANFSKNFNRSQLESNSLPSFSLSFSTSPKAKPTQLPPVDSNKVKAIFEIYTDSAYGNFRKFQGMGFLVSNSLCITTHITLPTAYDASVASLQFLDSPENFYYFLPQSFFFTSKELDFTIVACGVKGRAGLSIENKFTLKEQDPIIIFNRHLECKHALIIDKSTFCYTSSYGVPNGLPIFNYNWEVQGMHTTFTPSYRINQALRIDVVFEYAKSSVLSVPKSPEVSFPAAQFCFYWFEWFSTDIYRLDTSSLSWSKFKPLNEKELGLWYFPWNSRTTFLATGEAVILGGILDSLGTKASIAFLYKPQKNTLEYLPEMLDSREAPALLTLGNSLYVLGGSTSKCEVLENYQWKPLSSMIHSRKDFAACFLNSYIYVVGGDPSEVTSRTVEKYSVAQNFWEIVPLMLPEPLVKPAAVSVSSNHIVVLGGSFSHKAFLLKGSEVVETQFLEKKVETIFPVFLNKGKLLVLNGNEGYKKLRLYTFPLNRFYLTKQLYTPQAPRKVMHSRTNNSNSNLHNYGY